MTDRKFWAVIRSFLTNEEMMTSNEISLKQGNDIISNKRKLAELLNYAYINVVEITVGKKPVSVLDKDNVTFSIAINTIVEEYKYHPSVLNIKKISEQAKYFSFSEVSTTDVLKLVKRININKAMGEDQISLNLIKIAGNFLVEPLTGTINSWFRTSTFLTWQKEPQLHLFKKVVLISIFTQTTDLLVF